MTDTRWNGQHTTGWDRLAVAVGEIFSPPLLAAVVIAIVGWTSARPHWHGLLWGLIVLIFVCGLPYAVIIQGVRRGTYTDHHLQLLAFVGWSRVRLRAHTPAQVAVGAIVGATIAGTCFTLLR